MLNTNECRWRRILLSKFEYTSPASVSGEKPDPFVVVIVKRAAAAAGAVIASLVMSLSMPWGAIFCVG